VVKERTRFFGRGQSYKKMVGYLKALLLNYPNHHP